MPISEDDIPNPDELTRKADTSDANTGGIHVCAQPGCENTPTTIVDFRWWCPRHTPADTETPEDRA
jgi:hypothetical protein